MRSTFLFVLSAMLINCAPGLTQDVCPPSPRSQVRVPAVTSRSPEVVGRLIPFVNRLAALPDSAVDMPPWYRPSYPSRHVVDSLWRVDSLTLKWALVDIMTKRVFSDLAAAFASEMYRSLYADPSAVLSEAPADGSDPRAHTILAALRGPIDNTYEKTLLLFACDAATIIMAYGSSSTTPPASNGEVDAVLGASRVLVEACRLAADGSHAKLMSVLDRFALSRRHYGCEP
jgi:hypothetical protein